MRLLLLFLLDRVAVATAASGCFDTRDRDGRLTKTCKAADLSDVPSGLDPNTKVLSFPDNLFTAVTWSSFQAFPEIYQIELTGNKISEVTPSSSPLLPTLRILRLSSNRLTSLPDHSFSACPALSELYLDNNNIQSLSDQTFSGLSKLEVLDLSSNHIKVLPKRMLSPLRIIETLYIEKNEIKLMPDDWFNVRDEVPYLYLSANPWDCTCPNLYLQAYLVEFDSNIYIREGDIFNRPEKVECGSPPMHKGKPVMTLEESDLCPPEVNIRGDFLKPEDPATTTLPPPIPFPTFPPAPTEAPTAAATPPEEVTQTITNFTEWSSYTELWTFDGVWDELVPEVTFFTVAPTTEGPAHRETTPAGTTTSLPPTQEAPKAATPEVTTLTTTMAATTIPATTMPATTMPATTMPATTIPATTMPATTMPATTMPATTKLVLATPAARPPSKARTARGAGVFCFWLFAGLLLLCVVSAGCMLFTLWRLLVWYVRVYRPLSEAIRNRKEGREGMRLLTYSGREETDTTGGGVVALYRSVLYVHRDEGEAAGREETAQEGEDQLPVTLKPTGEGGAAGGGERVYRKTFHRLISREDEIEGWRDVVAECRVPAEEAGRRGGGQGGGTSRERGGGVSRKRYSVILREEREEAGLGTEDLDWVVGGWEVNRAGDGGAEPRSSWGEWLEHYLPRMPWAVTMPTEGQVPQ